MHVKQIQGQTHILSELEITPEKECWCYNGTAQFESISESQVESVRHRVPTLTLFWKIYNFNPSLSADEEVESFGTKVSL